MTGKQAHEDWGMGIFFPTILRVQGTRMAGTFVRGRDDFGMGAL